MNLYAESGLDMGQISESTQKKKCIILMKRWGKRGEFGGGGVIYLLYNVYVTFSTHTKII
jgi:hypothetical protein